MSQRYGVSDEEREIEEGIRANWQPVVEAAGFYHPSQDTWTVYMLGGHLMGDRVVRERAMAKFAAFRPTEGQMFLRDPYLAVVQEMTPLEKQALRERIMQATAKARADRAAKAK